MTSSTFRNGTGLWLPVYAPYHAAALYKNVDPHAIAKGSRSKTLQILKSYRPNLALLSTSNGKPITAETALELLTQVIQEILKATLRWDIVLANCVSELESAKPCEANVLAFGTTKAANSLKSALQGKGDSQITLHNTTSWMSKNQSGSPEFLRSPKKSKLAIVGLAGRFPGGADLEAFWEMLEKGLDVHREVDRPFSLGTLSVIADYPVDPR